MKLLFSVILKNVKHRILLAFTFVTILLVSFSSQLEMVVFGILADTQIHTEVNKEETAPAIKSTSGLPGSFSEILDSGKQKELKEHWFAKIKHTFNLDKFQNLMILIILIAVFKAFSMFSHQYLTRVVAIRTCRDLRQTYFEHIQKLSLSFYQKYNVGALSARVVADANTIAQSINAFLINYFQTPFTLITTLLACFLLNWQLSSIIFIGLPLIGYPIVFLAKRIKRIAKQLQKNQENFSTVLLDFLRGIQSIKIFGMEKYSFKKYKEQNNLMARLEEKSARYSVSSRPVLHLIGSLFIVTILLLGLFLFEMPFSEILTFCGFLYLFYEPIKKFAEENANIQRGIAATERMFEVLNEHPDIVDISKAKKFSDFTESIELKNLSFRYGEEWILKNINLKIKKRTTVAIVGPTGSGKSTLVQLIPRLYDPQKGEILIDGVSLKEFQQNSLRKSIAFVPQDPFLFLDTIAQNISFGNSFTEQEIKTAAIQAHAHEFIDNLPDKYNHMLTDAGSNLSGGQQQRLAIARAIIKKSPILIMDEATSALDPISENYIKQAIIELHGEVTQIIIAHRLSTIENADLIIFLKNGEIISQGTKAELLKTCSHFQDMWNTLHQTDQHKTTI
jgi:ABC-type multidrug transport system fused ATPase/permease subunit